jgi:hypothetical protein
MCNVYRRNKIVVGCEVERGMDDGYECVQNVPFVQHARHLTERTHRSLVNRHAQLI